MPKINPIFDKAVTTRVIANSDPAGVSFMDRGSDSEQSVKVARWNRETFHLSFEDGCPEELKPFLQFKAERLKERQQIIQRVFIGVYPCALVYADRKVEEHGDYKTLGMLMYSSLDLDVRPDCPPELRKFIIEDAAAMQAQAGTLFPVSSSGQYIVLGSQHMTPRQVDEAYLANTKARRYA